MTTRVAAPVRNAVPILTRRRRVTAVAGAAGNEHRRLLVLGGLLSFWMLVVVGRLVQLQVYQADSLREKAEQQQQKILKTLPHRGKILDRHGRELATSLKVASVYVAPKNIRREDLHKAEQLAAALGLDRETVLEKLTSSRTFVALKRKVTPEEEQAVRNLDMPGVELVTETQRHYPQGFVGASVVGFVGVSGDEVEEHGQAGVERAFETHLVGKPGRVIVEQDARRRVFNVLEESPEVGQSLILTLDTQIQFEVERILSNALREQGGKGGAIVVMYPATGEVLAMASSFGDPLHEPLKDPEALLRRYRNRAVMDHYEPGSVFKIVTYAGALEEKLLTRQQKIDCQGGAIQMNGHTILDGGRYGALTVEEAFAKSSNVAAIKTGLRLGRDRLLRYVERFGFGHPTEVGLAGETAGGVGQLSDALLGALPMGYSINVTLLQLCAAAATIANGGVWVQPHLAQRIVSTTGDVLLEIKPRTRRVVSRETAQDMTHLMRAVVERGTGKRASVRGYTTAGKTGTAKKVERGRYSETRYVASFVGFAPATRPALAIAVMMDEPPYGRHHGGDAAAPVFAQVVETLLPLLKVPPDVSPDIDPAWAGGAPIPLEAPPDGRDDSPRLYAAVPSGEEAAVVQSHAGETTIVVTVSDGRRMPDLRGLGIRSALIECAKVGVRLEVHGFGTVRTQSIPPGTLLTEGETCKVTLDH
ncbi:MAG: transpeptidase family protein [Chloracidobacterium sp.]|nr:transpeptidase family protein [Chloracidobacterium sp.]MDW8216303.1 penicillin-binding protein [Acidobacteriota bacterium]